MYVCICNQITESEIRREIEHGAESIHQLRESLGVTNQCGKCANCVKSCLKDHKESIQSSNTLLPAAYSA